ncbi:MAG: ABC transporter permease [Alphaproteobacteria bacterium]|nr:ABC transporter permease [Alphaproteobacteria bacterium]
MHTSSTAGTLSSSRKFEFRRHPYLLAVGVFILLSIVNAILQPSFLRPAVAVSNLASFMPLILVAVGQTYVILASDIDLSVGFIISVVNVVVVTTIEALGGSGGAILAGFAAGIATGILAGLVNGLCVAVLRFQPIVTTFATGIIFAGVALWILPQAGGQVPAIVWRTYAGAVAGVPVVLWLLAAVLVFIAVFARTRFHTALVAVGGNMQAAYQTKLPVTRIRITSYVISGLFAALAALALVGETASGDPLLGGAFSLSSITAVVLGGTALAGGRGGALGSLFGAIILGLIANVIFFAQLPFEYQNLAQGLVILLALAGGVFVARR